jgi:hypothetical protein
MSTRSTELSEREVRNPRSSVPRRRGRQAVADARRILGRPRPNFTRSPRRRANSAARLSPVEPGTGLNREAVAHPRTQGCFRTPATGMHQQGHGGGQAPSLAPGLRAPAAHEGEAATANPLPALPGDRVNGSVQAAPRGAAHATVPLRRHRPGVVDELDGARTASSPATPHRRESDRQRHGPRSLPAPAAATGQRGPRHTASRYLPRGHAGTHSHARTAAVR